MATNKLVTDEIDGGITRLNVDMGDGTHAEQVIAHPPASLLTGTTNPRMRVDIGQTGFFEGREFRLFYDFDISTGTSVYLKFVSAVNFILFEQVLAVDSGGIEFTANLGATETTPFSTPITVFGKNRMSDRPTPFYTTQVSVSTGGAVTGGTVSELFRVVSAGATAQQATVGGFQASERGLPAGTYYLRLRDIGNGSATGVYALVWEERP